VFTRAWLFTALPPVMFPPQPAFCNSDGEDLMFHDLRFPFATGVAQKDGAVCLDGVKNFIPEGQHFWNWFSPRRTRPRKKAIGMVVDSQMADRTVLGSLELEAKLCVVRLAARTCCSG
jgi:hypothetical protein